MAVVIVGQEHGRRDIVIERQNGTLQRISETHRSYDALQYPLIFVSGEDGYAINIASFDVQSNDYHTTKTVSAQEFYSYRLMIRHESYNHIHHYRQLANMFWVGF